MNRGVQLGRQLFGRYPTARIGGVASTPASFWATTTAAFDPLTSLLPSSWISVRHRSNRSRRGLYNGKDIRSGNNVSFSMRHTKRTFKPNVFVKRVYSEVLDAMIPFHLTASTLRSIDKCGGLDNYLFRYDFPEGEGHTIKKKIQKRLKNQARLASKQGTAPLMNASTSGAADAAPSP